MMRVKSRQELGSSAGEVTPAQKLGEMADVQAAIVALAEQTQRTSESLERSVAQQAANTAEIKQLIEASTKPRDVNLQCDVVQRDKEGRLVRLVIKSV